MKILKQFPSAEKRKNFFLIQLGAGNQNNRRRDVLATKKAFKNYGTQKWLILEAFKIGF